jgi:DNA-binding response OmpR family regulator
MGEKGAILLIEDDPAQAAEVQRVLVADGYAVESCADAESGFARAARTPFALIIVDRMLPDVDGLTVVERLRGIGLGAPIMVLSALSRADQKSEGLETGADEYLGKPFEPIELSARVRALLRRATPQAHPEVMLVGDLEIWLKARRVHRFGKHIPVSPREFTLVKFLADNAGATVTRMMLLEKVWNLRFDPQTNVVDVHVGRLRRKLEDGFDRPVIHTVRGEGYMLDARG